ncbi:hypothetical protein WICPIJ_005575 [Wickerhamomyces pijperi]|uniref:SF3A2 domain-containing protein n=1 Tax=Wickerhamomyces pijperi TaxID=599730 RepID=A0A9P8Q3L8_WICPI|nr:hypothetical protein WICPIJ_005575 [Wickerhamomyces pijperi]
MDYQNRIGSKKGGGGVASSQELNVAQRQRVSELFDIKSNPYIHKNHLGQFECKLCLTLHNTKESFLNHSQAAAEGVNQNLIESYTKIGLPSYKIQKLRNEDGDLGLFITVNYPKSTTSASPFFRFMSSFEVNSMKPQAQSTDDCQYLILHCKPYDNISIKLPNQEILKDSNFWDHWDNDIKEFYIQFFFKSKGDTQT